MTTAARHPQLAAVTLAIGLTTAPASCGRHQLVPERAAETSPGRYSATRDVAGIRLIVSGGGWDGYPADLGAVITPVAVTIENRSGKAMLIRYRGFVLAGNSGQQYPALPALSLEPRTGRQVFTPAYSSFGFAVSPHYASSFPGIIAWFGPFPPDDGYHQRHFAAWPPGLPSHDMLARALPEGVLENRGTITGFLYFQNAARHERRVDFRAHVVEYPPAAEIAVAEIAFRRE